MILSEVNFSERLSALQNKQKTRKRILPFVTESVSPINARSQTYSYEQMASYTKPAQKNI